MEHETNTPAQTEQNNKNSSQKIRKKKKLPVALSIEEFISLIKATKKEHHKVAFLLGFGSGLRLSEILNLEARNVNLAEKKILIEQGKGNKDRITPTPKGFKESHLKFLPLKNQCGGRALEKAFISTAKRAGLLEIKPTLHFHSLRHGFATRCIKQNIPLHHIRTLMGHSNISVTSVYLETNPKDALKAFEELF